LYLFGYFCHLYALSQRSFLEGPHTVSARLPELITASFEFPGFRVGAWYRQLARIEKLNHLAQDGGKKLVVIVALAVLQTRRASVKVFSYGFCWISLEADNNQPEKTTVACKRAAQE
jgi:hypothetical protein